MPVAGVVLAAGGGQRMGRPKALVELDGLPLVVRAQAVLRGAGCDPVAVVTGAAHDQVGALVDGPVIHHAGWADGQAGSVRAALTWAVGAGTDAVVVLPVDTPGITAAVVRRLIGAWTVTPDRVAVATYDGQLRNPVLLPAAVWSEVGDALHGDAGAGPWLRRHPDRVVTVDCTDLGDPTDLDTPADLQRWLVHRRSATPPQLSAPCDSAADLPGSISNTPHVDPLRPRRSGSTPSHHRRPDMELEHTFTVPVPPAQAFEVLQDIERIGPCMPGASIDSVDGTSFSGKVKVKIGPIQVTYAGEAEYAEVDREALAATITARGKETRGSGTANATVTAKLREVDGGTEAHVVTDLAITGRPAQFGRGVMEEVGQKLITQFADCLASKLGEEETATPPGGDAAPDTSTTQGTATERAAAATTAASTSRPAPTEPEAINLLDVAGAPVAKRLAPVIGGLVVLLVLWRLIRR